MSAARPATLPATLYEDDFHAWAVEQAALLREGRLAAVDIAHIAEEIESRGRSQRRELASRLRILLHHLLKWRCQPVRRGQSWRLTILNARDELETHLRDNPSRRPTLPSVLTDAYRLARRDAAAETDLPEALFPDQCPWSIAEITGDFWPEQTPS